MTHSKTASRINTKKTGVKPTHSVSYFNSICLGI